MEKISCFCLPFAGGNRYSYRNYEETSPSFLQIIPLEYPGRGARMKEQLVADIDCLVQDLYRQIEGLAGSRKYVIYGHSMGGLLACLLARYIRSKNHPMPLHIFITGTPGPAAPSRGDKKRHLLNSDDFVAELRESDGMPDGFLEDLELVRFFEPVLRADFTAIENYIYEEAEPLNIPLTVITGAEEDMLKEEIFMWQKETNYPVDFSEMPGGHFFIFKNAYKILRIISDKILSHRQNAGVRRV
jgi:surfactin synthase thioesterase subunit